MYRLTDRNPTANADINLFTFSTLLERPRPKIVGNIEEVLHIEQLA